MLTSMAEMVMNSTKTRTVDEVMVVEKEEG